MSNIWINKNKYCYFFQLSLVLLALAYPVTAAQIHLQSPDKDLIIKIYPGSDEHLMMQITRDGITVLKPSRLGIIVNGKYLGEKAVIGKSKRYSIDESYPWRGNHSLAINRCNGAKIALKTGNFKWLLDVRAYNDGAAFMYSYNAGRATLFGGESTVLCFDDSLRAKYMRHRMGEESRIYSGPVTDIYNNTKTKLTMPPLLLYPEDTSSYIAILEGGGFNFHGYALEAVGSGNFKIVYAEKPDGWKVDAPVATAWKIICTVNSLNELTNSDLVHNVCPPPDTKLFPKGLNEDWIKPGKSTWNWWARLSSDHKTQMMLVDKAAQIGAEYHLVDIGWDQGKTWQDETKNPYDYLKILCDYAAKKEVGIFVWKCSDTSLNLELKGSPDSKFWKLKPVHVSQNLDEMQAEIKRIADAGAKGIKLDYIGSENSKWKTYMGNFLKVCAEYKLMVDFHGCPIPAGESRTYPNELTREAIFGGEKLRGGSNGAAKMPTASYIDLAFTRMLAGHADYTPGIFNPEKGKGFTHSMQLASAVILTSPYLCWADHPDNYLASDGIEIIRTLPTVWDETIIMNGSALDKLLVFARRNGRDWYIAAINGYADKQQDYNLDLSFLSNGDYDAFICKDHLKTRSYPIETKKQQVKKTDTLKMSMLPNGGFVIRLTEK